VLVVVVAVKRVLVLAMHIVDVIVMGQRLVPAFGTVSVSILGVLRDAFVLVVVVLVQ